MNFSVSISGLKLLLDFVCCVLAYQTVRVANVTQHKTFEFPSPLASTGTYTTSDNVLFGKGLTVSAYVLIKAYGPKALH